MKIKMADVKPETLKPDIGDGIYAKCQRSPHIFCIEQQSGTNFSTGRRQRGWKLKIAACYRKWLWNNINFSLYTWWLRNSNGYIYVFDVKQHDWSKHCRLSRWVRNKRWRLVTSSGFEITCISACIHDSNGIPTAILMFSRSGIMTALVRILSFVRVSGISKVAAYNRKCLRNNVYLSFYTSAVMMHDLKNIGMAVGILLPSCVQAELHVISYPLMVTSRHLWFLTHPDTRQCLDQSSRVAWHRKHRLILSKAGVCCFIGIQFVGALACAVDLVLYWHLPLLRCANFSLYVKIMPAYIASPSMHLNPNVLPKNCRNTFKKVNDCIFTSTVWWLTSWFSHLGHQIRMTAKILQSGNILL